MLVAMGIVFFTGSYKSYDLWQRRPVTGVAFFLAGVALWIGPRVVDIGE
ncbi:hypothetical protein [Halobacterium jilantaiense]|uniref:Uncharacterized protein n=1 Tax=Halobacterium jilantaiense TaxID=355548 RepID=A0A1I0QSC9_9EURY|nr:hypothetical protein [Halobacterium jilantaiense]SEW30514.1 hypothetical protein SAMN04487945_2932 [Halobacterium jilantaiense]